ncbi:MAG: Gfo/Idh/MocA family protein [Bacilli bacterium]
MANRPPVGVVGVGSIALLAYVPNYAAHPDVDAVKRYVDAGELGEIYYAKTRILRRRGTPAGWFWDVSVSGGGPLTDLGVHVLNLVWGTKSEVALSPARVYSSTAHGVLTTTKLAVAYQSAQSGRPVRIAPWQP